MRRAVPPLTPLLRIDLTSLRRPSLPVYARVAILWATWCPFLACFLYLKRLVPVFDKVHEHEVLLPLSTWFLRLSHLDEAASRLPFPDFLLTLAVGDWAVGRHRWGRALYHVWFVVVVSVAAMAFLLCATAAFFPVFRSCRGS